MLWDPFSYQREFYGPRRFRAQRPFPGFMDWNYTEPEEQQCRCGRCFPPNFRNEEQLPGYSQRPESFLSNQGSQRQGRNRNRHNYPVNFRQLEQPLQQQRRGIFANPASATQEDKRGSQREGRDQEGVFGETSPQLDERNPSRRLRSSNLNTRRSPTVSSSQNNTVDIANHGEKPQIPLGSKAMHNRQLKTEQIEEAPVELEDEMKIGQNIKTPAATQKENIAIDDVREKSVDLDEEVTADCVMPGKRNFKGSVKLTVHDAANTIKAAKNYVASNNNPEIQQKLSASSLVAEKLSKIDEVSVEVDELSRGVKDFDRNEKNFRYRYLEEMLTKCLLKLDDIQADGIEEVRNGRKSVVDRINSELVCLEEKLTAGHSLLSKATQVDAVEGHISEETDSFSFPRGASNTSNDNIDQTISPFLNDKQSESYQQSSVAEESNCDDINGNAVFFDD